MGTQGLWYSHLDIIEQMVQQIRKGDRSADQIRQAKRKKRKK